MPSARGRGQSQSIARPQEIELNLDSRFLGTSDKGAQGDRTSNSDGACHSRQDPQRGASKDEVFQEAETLAEVLLCDLFAKQCNKRCCKTVSHGAEIVIGLLLRTR